MCHSFLLSEIGAKLLHNEVIIYPDCAVLGEKLREFGAIYCEGFICGQHLERLSEDKFFLWTWLLRIHQPSPSCGSGYPIRGHRSAPWRSGCIGWATTVARFSVFQSYYVWILWWVHRCVQTNRRSSHGIFDFGEYPALQGCFVGTGVTRNPNSYYSDTLLCLCGHPS